MRILLDECMPKRVPLHLNQDNEIRHVRDLGWHSIRNGDLLRKAEGHFDLLVTVDKQMRYQQSLKGLTISVAVLDIPNRQQETFERYLSLCCEQLSCLEPGTFVVIHEAVS